MNEKLLEEIKQFLNYAERESVIDIEVRKCGISNSVRFILL